MTSEGAPEGSPETIPEEEPLLTGENPPFSMAEPPFEERAVVNFDNSKWQRMTFSETAFVLSIN